MTPEQRAAKALQIAAEMGILIVHDDSPRWHSLITQTVTEALREARRLCTFVPDMLAISDLMLGEPTQPSASKPGPIECFVCEGAGALGGVACAACNGRGIIIDSGAAPDPNPGLMALKPCGCAADWIGAGASPEWQLERRKIWEQQGWESRPAEFKDASPLLTAGAGCKHEQRATPRPTPITVDLSDLPPGGER